MPRRSSKPGRPRTTGLLVALALGLISAGVVVLVALTHRGASKSPALPAGVIDIGKAPDIKGGAGATDITALQESAAARLQFVDKLNQSRVSSELAYDRLDPVGQGYYTLTQPRAWIYMKDGRTIHIRADQGRVKMPSRSQQPEAGEFRGGVIVRLFPPSPARGDPQPIDPETAVPTLMAVTDAVSFDSVLLELQTQNPVSVSTRNLLFDGDGLLVRGNQSRERIELLKTRGKSVRFNPKVHTDRPVQAAAATNSSGVHVPAASPDAGHPSGASAGHAGALAPDPAAASTSPPTPPPAEQSQLTARPEAPPREQLYRTLITDDVTVSQTTRRLNADTLEILARTIDNKMPEGAFGVWPKPGAQNASSHTNEPTQPLTASNPVARGHSSPGRPDSGSAPLAQHTGLSSAVPIAARTSLFESAGDEDIVMTWTGSLVLTPVPEGTVVPELADGNQFAARFSADRPGGMERITATDSQTGSDAVFAHLEYFATQRTVHLASGDNAPQVVLNAPGSGRIEVPDIRADLGSGVGHIAGGGTLTSLRKTASGSTSSTASADSAIAAATAPESPIAAEPAAVPAAAIASPQATDSRGEFAGQIRWTDQADVQFRVVDGRLRDDLEWAAFTGDVVARDKESIIAGDFLRAEFMPVGKQPTAMKRLRVEGSVMAIGGTGKQAPDAVGPTLDPYVIADELDVAFLPSTTSPNDSDPVRAVARGAVRAADRTSSLSAGSIEATMARDDHQRIVATDLIAAGDVRVSRLDGVWARADLIHANPVLRTADLTGEVVTLARGASTIVCTQAQLDDASGTMLVHGLGTFDHTHTPESGAAPLPGSSSIDSSAAGDGSPTHLIASWTRSMLFDNNKGIVECNGDTAVVATSAASAQTVKAERLRLFLSPAAETRSQADAQLSPSTSSQAGDDRKLLRAEALGEVVDREGGANATVETRRYALPASPEEHRVLEQVMYIEGPRIIADDQHGKLVVPAAGRAIVRDQRASGNAPSSPPSGGLPMSGSSARGTSRFTWAGTMEFVRASGILTMDRDVEMVYLPLGATQATRLNADRLEALFAQPSVPGQGTSRGSELIKAEALGMVRAESGSQRLEAERFLYDALRNTAEAFGQGATPVTVYDDRKPPPLVAHRIFWDLSSERIEITDPAPITAPR